MQNLKFCIFYLTKTYIKVIIIVWISNNLAYSRMGGEIVASTNKVEEQEVAQILDEKEHKKRNNGFFSIIKKIFDIIFWLVFAILALIWIVDFINVNNDKEPVFCIKTEVHEYDDGQTVECTGLGYKVYKYNRTSTGTGYEFGPFFVKMKGAE